MVRKLKAKKDERGRERGRNHLSDNDNFSMFQYASLYVYHLFLLLCFILGLKIWLL